MNELAFPIDGVNSLADMVSPTIVSCDASYETTNENGATTFNASSSTNSSSNSDAAVVVERRGWTTRATSKMNKVDAIPKAITLTTTAVIPKQQTQHSYHRNSSSSGSSIISFGTNLSTAELCQQLQKRLRPEDIPSIPTLSSRFQRRRYSIPSTSTATADPMVKHDKYRPVCNFVNFMGTNSRTIHGTSSSYVASTTRTSCYYSRFGKFQKSLITLHDDNDMDHMRVGDLDDSNCFAPIITINDNDDDMLLLSNLDTFDWGILPTDVEGTDIGRNEENDAFILNEYKDAEMMLTFEEPYRFTSTCSVPIAFGNTANKMKHSDNMEMLMDHSNDRALFDAFALPQCHDDAKDLFDFDL